MGAFQSYRRAIIEALPVRRRQVVLNWGPGRGCAAACSRTRWARRAVSSALKSHPRGPRWRANVSRAKAGVTSRSCSRRPRIAQIAVTADAALFCAVHDILQSPGALGNVMTKLRPGAWVSAGGGKWAAPWMVAVNLQARMLNAPFVRSFEGFRRAVESSGAAARGRPRPRGSARQRLYRDRPGAAADPVLASGKPGPVRPAPGGSGCRAYAGRPGLAGMCSVLPRPGAADQQASTSARVNKCGALMQAP